MTPRPNPETKPRAVAAEPRGRTQRPPPLLSMVVRVQAFHDAHCSQGHLSAALGCVIHAHAHAPLHVCEDARPPNPRLALLAATEVLCLLPGGAAKMVGR